MAKKIWLVIAAGALAAAFLGCQSDVTEPAGMDPGLTDDKPIKMIEGYVYDTSAINTKIPNAHVVWLCPGGPVLKVGEVWTGLSGKYTIMGDPDVWAYYEGNDMEGYAYAEGYEDGGPVYVYDFSLDDVPYWRDIGCDPE